ncbi:hypothetical protein [Streptomyces sp. CdTB01]|uniref:hypothetical protein n=1 Tax=Streptomyces sp. CdTB01 TaxID=1725411 RepID=UPI00073A9F7B|nr:hypothetical protein [Streptomyces sp. CdTB01]ALV39181.1 hypothetical protein AS200_44540 [Streptomyces sp. CdTB01]
MLMTLGSALRSSRPVARTGAVLVVLVAALVHLLACAHGPTPTGVGQPDAILTATVSCAQASGPADDESAVREDGPAQENDVRCWGVDEPTVQPPRAIAPAAEVIQDALPIDPTSVLPGTVGEGPPPPPAGGTSSAQQQRALLGVWRT